MQYTPFASDIELPFYTALASLKINHDRLDDTARNVLGLYEIRPSDPPNVSSRVQIHGNALTSDTWVSFCYVRWLLNRASFGLWIRNRAPAGYYRAEGLIKNVNTIEEYRNVDKTQVIQEAGAKVSIERPSKIDNGAELNISTDMERHPWRLCLYQSINTVFIYYSLFCRPQKI